MLTQLSRKTRSEPKVLLAHAPDSRVSPYVSAANRQFRSMGIELIEAVSADEAYQLIQTAEPNIVFLAADLPDESGYLACAKIKLTMPKCRVYVLSHEATSKEERLARFAGANALVDTENGMQGLLSHVNSSKATCRC